MKTKSEKHFCLCGCGRIAKRQFVQGHDGKLKSLVLQFVNDGITKPKVLDEKPTREYLKQASWMTTSLKRVTLS